jgi:mRNA-degrading endonuclease RelE of RelBE toxin-antitoxin system
VTTNGWQWTFTPQALDQFDALDPHIQDRIVTKLDEVVESEWRDPEEFLDPPTGGPFSKLRIGNYRLACTLDHSDLVVRFTESNTGAEPTPLTTTEPECTALSRC